MHFFLYDYTLMRLSNFVLGLIDRLVSNGINICQLKKSYFASHDFRKSNIFKFLRGQIFANRAFLKFSQGLTNFWDLISPITLKLAKINSIQVSEYLKFIQSLLCYCKCLFKRIRKRKKINQVVVLINCKSKI